MKRDIQVDKIKKNFYVTALLLIVVLTVTYVYTRPLKVIEVTEGNILVLDNGSKVRLIGVSTGVQAGHFIRKWVEGKEVKLRYDQEKMNRNGQLLAYVYLPDGRFLNAEIIKQGYASINKEMDFKYVEVFEHYQREAKEKKKGMWAD